MIPFVKPLEPNVPLFTQYFSKSIKQNHYTNFGPCHNELKQRFFELTGISDIVLTCNATVALDGLHHILARRCGIVYLPSFTFPATNQGAQTSIIHGSTISGGTDIGRTAWKCNEYVGSYAVTVNPFGSLNPVCKKPLKAFYWIVDNAAGLLSQAKDWLDAGADAVVYSLHATKILSACEGGVVFFNNSTLYNEYCEYINFGFVSQPDGSRTVNGIGSNHKMSELSAAYCLMSLDSLENEIEKRSVIAEQYKSICIQYDIPYIPSLQAFWMLGKETAAIIRRFALVHGVDIRPYYQKLPFDNSGCNVTTLFTTNGFCLPVRSTLTASELTKIYEMLHKAKSLDLI